VPFQQLSFQGIFGDELNAAKLPFL